MAGGKLKQHTLSEMERVWLHEAISAPKFDPKVAKIKLHGRIADDFNPNKIDPRLYANGKVTPLGLYLLDPQAEIFVVLEQVIQDIRAQVFAKPGIDGMSASDIAERLKLPEEAIGRALHMLGQLGGFFSSSSSLTNPERVTNFALTGDEAYDEYRRYRSLDEVMDRVYSARAAHAHGWSLQQIPASIDGEAPVEQQPVKRNTAFVLMAIDPSRAELEDVYNAIKEACREFGITAYRADEIEHQDRITDIVLKEIATCEYLIADLSDERPNVYYEVGYAHALNKKPILYRRTNTRVHFDLYVHNVPEYKNTTELRKLLRQRFEAILGRKSKST